MNVGSRERDFTRVLGWPGYRVYRYELDETAKKLKLWVRRKPVRRGFECSGCGRRVHKIAGSWERGVADLDCFEYRTTVMVDVHRLDCAACGLRVEKIEQVPSKAPYTKRFEDQIGQACESAAARRVGGEAAQGPAEAHGRGRNPPGKEGQVHYRDEQPGNGGAAV
ncbi:MAG: transposase family protein, partial [Acidobacteriota bacterium]|nr:transposase family protein [Acidobacteriota bacterium]